MLCIPNPWSQHYCAGLIPADEPEFKGALSYYPSESTVNVTQARVIWGKGTSWRKSYNQINLQTSLGDISLPDD